MGRNALLKRFWLYCCSHALCSSDYQDPRVRLLRLGVTRRRTRKKRIRKKLKRAPYSKSGSSKISVDWRTDWPRELPLRWTPNNYLYPIGTCVPRELSVTAWRRLNRKVHPRKTLFPGICHRSASSSCRNWRTAYKLGNFRREIMIEPSPILTQKYSLPGCCYYNCVKGIVDAEAGPPLHLDIIPNHA